MYAILISFAIGITGIIITIYYGKKSLDNSIFLYLKILKMELGDEKDFDLNEYNILKEKIKENINNE